jgi:uncharacterized membrane protein YgdD (TMEM256/DUF423 family)
MKDFAVRMQGSAGALLAMLAIGLSAWASHGLAPGREQHNVLMACLYAFGHGAVLVVLAPRALPVLGRVALWLILLGVLLFSGSLLGGVLLAWPTRAAPAGGMLMMGGWLLLALSHWQRQR